MGMHKELGPAKDKAPLRTWEEMGLLTYVDAIEIHPDLIADYINKQAKKYNIVKLALDNFRYALMAKSLQQIGFDATVYKNIRLVRPSDIMKVAPVIDSAFNNQSFIWADQPLLRWSVNNTKQIRMGKTQGQDIGNYIYAKIEAKSRKNDSFMALVHSMIIEQDLPDMQSNILDLEVRYY